MDTVHDWSTTLLIGALGREGAIETMEKVASSSQATGTRVYKTSGYEVCFQYIYFLYICLTLSQGLL